MGDNKWVIEPATELSMTSLRIPPRLKTALDLTARKLGKSRTELILIILDRALPDIMSANGIKTAADWETTLPAQSPSGKFSRKRVEKKK